MPGRRGNRTQGRSQTQGQPFPAQDDANSIPFYNARLFAMYESLIQSYTHFTYHSNHMFHVLERALHGTQTSINSNPYPWLLIPHPPHQSQQQPPRQSQQPRQPQPRQSPQSHQPQQQPHQQPHQQPQQPQQQQQQQQPPINAWRSHARTPPLRTPPLRTPPLGTTLENNIVNALMGMLYQPEEPRLTQAELNERIEEFAHFQNIVNPLNTVCSITQDAFEPNQRVVRIRHCGHIFSPDSLMQWLRMNNTCPTCRHDLMSSTHDVPPPATAPPATAAPEPMRGISIPLESDININTFYNELLRNSGNLPGFELNTVNDDSIVFSFDLMSRPGASGSAPAPAPGPRNIDDVD